jgi:hypothetical protein
MIQDSSEEDTFGDANIEKMSQTDAAADEEDDRVDEPEDFVFVCVFLSRSMMSLQLIEIQI